MSKTEENGKVLPINGYGYCQHGYRDYGDGAGFGDRYGLTYGSGFGDGHGYDFPIFRAHKRLSKHLNDGDGYGYGYSYGYYDGDGDNGFNEEDGEGYGNGLGTPSEF